MRKYIFFLCVVISFFSNTVSASISINNAQKCLISRQAEKYQWYFNGKLLMGENSRILSVKKSGLYEVELVSSNQMHSREKIMVQVTEKKIVRIHLIGDSTMQTYRSSYYPLTGWGQVFPEIMVGDSVQKINDIMDADSVVIINHAIGGRSTKKFWVEGRWAAVYDILQEGDYVFIQFGHNDADYSHEDRYVDTAGYKQYLRQYVAQSKEKKAIPVLITPVNQNYPWSAEGLTSSHGNYEIAMKEVARELKVPMIDLTQRSVEQFDKMGQDYCTQNYFMNLPAGVYTNYPDGRTDNTHFQPEGAKAVAYLVYQGLKDLRHVEVTVSPDFAGYVNGDGWYEVKYGKGIELLAYSKMGYVFDAWNGDASSEANPYVFDVDTSLQIMADFKEAAKPQYWIKANVEGNGFIVKSPVGNFFEEGTEVSLEAIPGESMKFHSWVGTLRDKSEQVSVSINQDMDINAVFIDEKATAFQVDDAIYVNTQDNGKNKFSGESYTILGDAVEDSVVWEIYPSRMGLYGTKFRYINENESAVLMDVYVNGVLDFGNLQLEKTGMDQWTISEKEYVGLKEGTNHVKIVNKSSNPIYLDCIIFEGYPFNNEPLVNIHMNKIDNFNVAMLPNPVTKGSNVNLLIEAEANNIFKIDVLELDGHLVSQFNTISSQNGYIKYNFDTRELNPGFYLFRISNENNVIIKKLVVH